MNHEKNETMGMLVSIQFGKLKMPKGGLFEMAKGNLPDYFVSIGGGSMVLNVAVEACNHGFTGTEYKKMAEAINDLLNVAMEAYKKENKQTLKLKIM